MNSGIIEYCFHYDEASQAAKEVFDRVMSRDWNLDHGIHPFDIDAVWAEVAKQLSYIGNRASLTLTRISLGDVARDEEQHIWSKLYQLLAGGEK